ncbi:MAG: PEP-CTERM sorting domain-containing protein [Candidatus Korobacteraceae bacterium]
MKLRIASLSLLFLCLIWVVPAFADSYDNGPVNGQVDAWTINFGFSVSNSLRCCRPGAPDAITGLDFYAWVIPGDTISNVEVQFGSTPFGNDLFDGVVSLTQSDCTSNQYGYNVCNESGSFSGPSINGNAWLTLSNATVPSGDPVYWDENSGVGCMSGGCPSQAQENTVGTIPSEAFTVLAATSTSTSTSSTTGTTPEPGSILLFGSGMLAAMGALRRKIKR